MKHRTLTMKSQLHLPHTTHHNNPLHVTNSKSQGRVWLQNKLHDRCLNNLCCFISTFMLIRSPLHWPGLIMSQPHVIRPVRRLVRHESLADCVGRSVLPARTVRLLTVAVDHHRIAIHRIVTRRGQPLSFSELLLFLVAHCWDTDIYT